MVKDKDGSYIKEELPPVPQPKIDEEGNPVLTENDEQIFIVNETGEEFLIDNETMEFVPYTA